MCDICLVQLAQLREVHRAIAVTLVVHVPVPVRIPLRFTLAFKFSISPYLDIQPLIRKHSYLEHRFRFLPWYQSPGIRPGGGAGG